MTAKKKILKNIRPVKPTVEKPKAQAPTLEKNHPTAEPVVIEKAEASVVDVVEAVILAELRIKQLSTFSLQRIGANNIAKVLKQKGLLKE